MKKKTTRKQISKREGTEEEYYSITVPDVVVALNSLVLECRNTLSPASSTETQIIELEDSVLPYQYSPGEDFLYRDNFNSVSSWSIASATDESGDYEERYYGITDFSALSAKYEEYGIYGYENQEPFFPEQSNFEAWDTIVSMPEVKFGLIISGQTQEEAEERRDNLLDALASGEIEIGASGRMVLTSEWAPYMLYYESGGGILKDGKTDPVPVNLSELASAATSDTIEVTLSSYESTEDFPYAWRNKTKTIKQPICWNVYTEDGSYEEPVAGGSQITINLPLSGDVVAEAVWEGVAINVHFWNLDEEEDEYFEYKEDGAIKPQTFHFGIPEKLNPNPFDKEDYIFVGWARYKWTDYIAYKDGDRFEPMEFMFSGDSDHFDVDLYAVWRYAKATDDILDMCIEGYDPLPVLFRDMSDVRSFRTGYWKWDFGDSFVYGCDTRKDIEQSASARPKEPKESSELTAFWLPGDNWLYGTYKNVWEAESGQTNFLSIIDSFHDSVPNCVMKFDYSATAPATVWESYHYKNMQTSGNDRHFTGVFMSSIEGVSAGTGIELLPPSEITDMKYKYRYKYWPNEEENGKLKPVLVPDATGIPADQCGRIMCEYEPVDFKNSVLHIYKGPGLYYSSMMCSSDKKLRGLDVDDKVYECSPESVTSAGECTKLNDAEERVDGCWVRVLPVCPCVTGFEVFGTSGANREFVTITADDYSCERMSISQATGLVTPNCEMTFNYNGETKTITATSGYAPYFAAACSGGIEARSLPVSGGVIDWSDWFTDYMERDHASFGEVVGGWPKWQNKDNEYKVVSGDHVYTMPGVYSVGIAPEFDSERIRRYMPTVLDFEECIDNSLNGSISANCIVVVEIPPKFDEQNAISTRSVNTLEFRTVVKDIVPNVTAGSYPISRMDWDFDADEEHKGTDTLTISTEGFYQLYKDVKDNKRPAAKQVVYKTPTTTAYLRTNVGNQSNYENYLIGNHLDPYRRYPAHKWSIDHTYVRSSVEDHKSGYIISCSAYAENTNTCVTASAAILPSGAGLPDFNVEEGKIEMVDIRTDTSFESNYVLQNTKDDRLYIDRVYDK